MNKEEAEDLFYKISHHNIEEYQDTLIRIRREWGSLPKISMKEISWVERVIRLENEKKELKETNEILLDLLEQQKRSLLQDIETLKISLQEREY